MAKSDTWTGAFDALAKTMTAKAGQDPDELARRRYLISLNSDAPTAWISDHLSESRRLRGAVYVAIKVLGDQAAAAEAKVYKWHPDARMGGDQDAREPVERNHDLARLFLHPNRHESAGYLRRRRVQQLCLTGTSLLWRVDNGMKTPQELWSVPTGTYQPVPISETWPDGAYRVMPWFPGPLAMTPGPWSQGGIIVPAEHMVAVRHPHPLVQQEGLSPLAACDLAMDTIESIDRARFNMTRQGAYPSAIAEMDPAVQWPTPENITRLRTELKQLVQGPDKAGSVAIMGPGVTLKPWLEGNVEVGWIESWSQLVGFVMSVIGIAKGMAFLDDSDSSYAKLYAMLKQFNLFSMCPLLQLLADADNMQLVWPFFGEGYFVEYEPKKVDDESILQQQNDTLLKCGGARVDEIRHRCGLPPDEEFGQERASASFKDPAQLEAEAKARGTGQPKTGPNGEPVDESEQDRPKNDQGTGSLPPKIGPARMSGFAGPKLNGKARINGRY